MTITADALELQHRLDASVTKVTDAHTRALVAAWVAAWAEVSGDLRDTLEDLYADGGLISRATVLRSVRLREQLALIADRLDTLAAGAGVTITSDLRQVVTDAAEAQARILQLQLPTDHMGAELRDLIHAVGRTSNPALDAIVRRTTEDITSLTRPLSADAARAVRRELVRAVAVGSNPKAAAARMVRRAEGKFNGGLTRALVISRTEVLDAHRAAAEVEQARHADVLTGWVWLCHLSPRTCPSCLAQSGTVHPLSEPGPYDHQQGRCSRMPKTKTWADLGFDVDEPADAVPDARAWFDALPLADQVAIMGRRRLELFRAGEISWEDLTVRRTTSGWRDSYGVAPLPQAGGSRGRLAS